MNRTLIAAALALGLAAGAQPAVAADPNMHVLDLKDNSAFFGAGYGVNDRGSFSDHFRFTVTENDSRSLDAIVSSINDGGHARLDITYLGLYYDIDGPGPNTNLAFVVAGRPIRGGDTDVWILQSGPLASGDYELLVGGDMGLAGGAAFGGAAVLAPVPEPAGWGMLAGGLGILALARRRLRCAAS